MWLVRPLDGVLSSRAKVSILRVLCQSPAPLNGREIARRTGLGQPHVWSVLRDLTSLGLLTARDLGRAKAYELANPDGPLVRELRQLFRAEDQRYTELLQNLSAGVPGLVSLILFGSEARGEAKPGSDTDLLFVVTEKTEELEARVRDNCSRLAEWYGLALSWHLADLGEVRDWSAGGDELWRSVLTDGITLTGKPVRELEPR